MKREDRELLELLGFLYLQYGKAGEARTIYAALCELTESRPLLTMTYAYCLAKAGQYAVALHYLELLGGERFSQKELSAFFLLRGNVLWNLGKDEEARNELHRFLICAQDGTLRHSLITKSAMEGAIQQAERDALAEEEILLSLRQPPPVRALRKLPRKRVITPYRVARNKTEQNNEGMWKRMLRFIARKELDREHSRQN